MFYQLFFLFMVNFLFGITPLFVLGVPDLSSFATSFFRFAGAGVVELAVAAVATGRLVRKSRGAFGRSVLDVWKAYFSSRNALFVGKRQWLYLTFLGFLLGAVSIPCYFAAFVQAGVVVTTITVNAGALLVVAAVNWLKGEERVDVLKVVDLLLLVAAIVTVGMATAVGAGTTHAGSPSSGLLLAITSIVVYSSFLLALNREPKGKLGELEQEGAESWTEASNFVRATLKLTGIHLFGALTTIPTAVVVGAFAPNSALGVNARRFLWVELARAGPILSVPATWALILLGTAVPYFLLVSSSVTWPRHALKHEVWASAFALVDPLVGLYVGFLAWGEVIRLDYMAFTTLFLAAGIAIRYFQGAANAQRVVFVVKLLPGHLEHFLSFLLSLKELDEVAVLAGNFDVVAHFTVVSLTRLVDLSNAINYYSGVRSAHYCTARPELP
ncbi:MAG: hypothetical protein Kow0069_14460 [Promethearchaeota archaeon]